VLYTKHLILFSSGFPLVSTALFVWRWSACPCGSPCRRLCGQALPAGFPTGSSSNVVHGKNVDLLITFVIVGMVTGMEICERVLHPPLLRLD